MVFDCLRGQREWDARASRFRESQERLKAEIERRRIERVKRRYPPGPWPFQLARVPHPQKGR
jgi:hypothetical protein